MQDAMDHDSRESFGDEKQSGTAGQGTGTAARMKEQVAAKVDDAKQRVSDLGRSAEDTVEAQRKPAAGALDRTADVLHEQGDRWADSAAGAAHATADRIQSVADYVRSHDTAAMVDDVGGLVRRFPGQSLAAAVVVGFLIGRSLRSSD